MALRLLALWLVLAGLAAAGLCLLLTGARLSEQRYRLRPLRPLRPLRAAPEVTGTTSGDDRSTLPV